MGTKLDWTKPRLAAQMWASQPSPSEASSAPISNLQKARFQFAICKRDFDAAIKAARFMQRGPRREQAWQIVHVKNRRLKAAKIKLAAAKFIDYQHRLAGRPTPP